MHVCVLCRQAALSMHPHLVRRLPHSDAYGAGHGGPDWYPAGISPWYLDKDGDIVGRDATAEHSHEWMDHLSLTKRDLHKSAIFIQKCTLNTLYSTTSYSLSCVVG